jgi:DNA repair protein RecN (Recombination protein N)
MLVELHVRDLGVIEEARLLVSPGMTALTGETGAGKTVLVEALALLVGARADAGVVRAGAEEAVVEGRFLRDGDDGEPVEVVLCRVVPRAGRSRAYVDGRLAPVAALADLGAGLVDLHGQHAHQSLLAAAAQRRALDRFAGTDLSDLTAARAATAQLLDELALLGGDERSRAREIDLLRFQTAELAAAGIDDPQEDRLLEAQEDLLADASAHREAAARALDTVATDGGVLDRLGVAIAELQGRAPLAAAHDRLRSAAIELDDVLGDLRSLAEEIEDDPERLAAVRARRQLLHDLQRKYGDDLAEVLAFAQEAEARLAALLDHERRAAELDAELEAVRGHEREAAAVVREVRAAAAGALGDEVQARLAELAMAKARVEVAVGEEPPGDDVRLLLAANPGADLAPLAKVASGGELARTMLALRLVLLDAAQDGAGTDGPSTLVFDEVDAGIGGAVGNAVGRALADLSRDRQVLVVTHLAQVASFADTHLVVAKHDDGVRTTATVAAVSDDDRVGEVARMLAGTPDSDATRAAAAELLASRAEAVRR